MPRFFPKSPAAILLIGATAGAIVGACVAMAAQPNMQAALGSMQAIVNAPSNSSTARSARPGPASATPAPDPRCDLDGTAG